MVDTTTAPGPTSPPVRKVTRAQVAGWQLNQLDNLLRYRRQTLGNDESGRRRLAALLDLGLTADRALHLARPWLSFSDVIEMIDAKAGPEKWTADTLGNLFQATLAEHLAIDLRNIACSDATRSEYQDALADRRRVDDRLRKARDRAKPKAITAERIVFTVAPGPNAKPIEDFPIGHRLVHKWLDGRGRQTISALAEAMISDPVVGRHHPDERQSYRKALMWKLHRWCNDLVDGGVLGHDKVPFERGQLRRVWRLDQVE
jgi:hypothetical protein